jgi:hypothetical protein
MLPRAPLFLLNPTSLIYYFMITIIADFEVTKKLCTTRQILVLMVGMLAYTDLLTGTATAESSEFKNGRGCWYVEGYSPRLYWNRDMQEKTCMFLRLHTQRQTLRSWQYVVPTV